MPCKTSNHSRAWLLVALHISPIVVQKGVYTVKVPLSQPCFDHFFGPLLGAMMKQVCWHSRRSKTYRGLSGHEDKARLTETRIIKYYDWSPLAMIDRVAVGHCGLLDLQKYCCLSKLGQFWQKRSLQNLIFGAVKHNWPWTPRSGSPQLRCKIDGQTIPNFDPLASCEDLFV